MMPETHDRNGGIQVVARSASILRLLGENPHGMSLGAMAAELGLAKSTVQRIVRALQSEGMVELSGQSGFQLGSMFSQLIYRQQADIVGVVRPFLEDLCLKIEETVALCALTGNKINTIDRCIAERTLRVVFPLGTVPNPPHGIAPGLAILSALPERRTQQILSQLTDPQEYSSVLADLTRVQDVGWARDADTQIGELSGYAVPLRSGFGVHAIVAMVPTHRASGIEETVISALKECREKLEEKIRIGPADE